MTEIEAREKYRELLSDDNFKKLEHKLNIPNIFSILKVDDYEIRHSDFLAWLLDPNENHGLGKLFLTEFLSGILVSKKAQVPDVIDIERLNYENVKIKREWENIDLLIVFDTLVICIENKINAIDGERQLTGYWNTINKKYHKRKKLFVYLTLEGDPPNNQPEGKPFIQYSHREIVEQLDSILEIYRKELTFGVIQYISDYVTTLKRKRMKDNEINKLANDLYKKHADIIDFIVKSKTDIGKELKSILQEMITNSDWVLGSESKNFVRFTTRQLDVTIPRKGTERGFRRHESFVFEFDLEKKTPAFRTAVPPGNLEIRDLLDTALSNINDFNNARQNRWLIHYKYKLDFNFEDLIGVDEGKIRGMLHDEWKKITDIVNKVEEELLKHRKEFQKYLD